jgi:hypothetical protein
VEHVWKFSLRDAPLEDLLATVRDLFRRFGTKIKHVHLPGYLPGFAEHRPVYCSRDMVFAVWSLLVEVGFEGFVVSEVAPEYQNANDLRMDVLLFAAWQQAASA